MNIIFVAGIHAVGKTTACQMVSNRLGIPHYSASQIIRDEKSSAVPDDSKLVADIEDNQKLLIQGVLRRLKSGRFLLDGHFTMRRKSDGDIETIHVDVFRKLCVRSVVLFTDHPEVISKRMQERDGILHPPEMFSSHQDAEINHANLVASQLSIPITRLHAPDAEIVIESFKKLVSS